MKQVIGLVGVKTSGKTTTSNIIKEIIPEAVEVALADKLKNTCAKVFDIDRHLFDNQSFKEMEFKDGAKELTNGAIGAILECYNIYMSRREIDSTYNFIGRKLNTPRQIAQIVGTEVLRAAGDEDIHCENLDLSSNVIIVSDIRFPNEFEYFKNNNNINFLPIYIQRDEAEKYITENSHSSEKNVFKFSKKCFEINNNSSLYDLEQQIAWLLFQTGFSNDIPKQA
jgi:hypothetical protein